MTSDLSETQESYARLYAQKILLGEEPKKAPEACLYGTSYFDVEVDGFHRWLTSTGLCEPMFLEKLRNP